jgi:hypothetical protein
MNPVSICGGLRTRQESSILVSGGGGGLLALEYLRFLTLDILTSVTYQISDHMPPTGQGKTDTKTWAEGTYQYVWRKTREEMMFCTLLKRKF